MRRHPGAIRREQRSMHRSRVALRSMRRTLDAVATTGGKVTTEQLVPAHGLPNTLNCGECLMRDVEIVALRTDGICPRCGADYGR